MTYDVNKPINMIINNEHQRSKILNLHGIIQKQLIMTKTLDRFKGIETTQPSGDECSVWAFVCLECKDRCEFVTKALKEGVEPHA